MTARSLLSSLSSRIFRKAEPNYRYHFIHIPKNGGNSVRVALKKRRDVSLSRPYHYRYVDIAPTVGADLQFFCIVRNPWSRTASRYQFGKQNCHKWPDDDPRKLFIEKASFADFVRERRIFEIPEHPGQPWMGPLNSWFNQLEWIKNEKGEIVCDCLRFELMGEDINDYFGQSIEMPHRNPTRQKYDYRDMYTDSLAEVVSDVFRDDIEYFGFDFEGPARRGIATGRQGAE